MRRVLLFVMVISFVVPVAWGEDVAWILFQKAEQRFRERSYGQALELYGEALAAQPALPEAQVGMARIYRTEGDFVLAERYYKMGIDNAPQLIVPEDVYIIRLELADMYETWGQEDAFREQLETIVAADPVFSSDELRWQKDAMYQLLLERGFDRVLVLYRLDFPQALAAHQQLGNLLSARAEYPSAIEHLLFAAVEQGGRIVDAMIGRRYDYQFTTVSDLLTQARSYAEIERYIEESSFKETLTSLAEALELSEIPGSELRANEIRSSLQF